MNNKRHNAILEIVRLKDIATQEELQRELRERGIEVTQATVSRDIRRLNLEKRQTPGGKSVYTIAPPPQTRDGSGEDSERLIRVLKDSVRSVECAQNIIVIKTVSGMAMAAAAAIDSMTDTGILGSIAGDDTVLVILNGSDTERELNMARFADVVGAHSRGVDVVTGVSVDLTGTVPVPPRGVYVLELE